MAKVKYYAKENSSIGTNKEGSMKPEEQMERNCIIVDGRCYVLRAAEDTEESICRQCAFDKTCKEMIEWPLCDMIHHVGDTQLIYVELKNDDRRYTGPASDCQ